MVEVYILNTEFIIIVSSYDEFLFEMSVLECIKYHYLY